MKSYQLFVRLRAGEPWSYVDTYRSASLTWTAVGLARKRGCQIKVTSGVPVDLDQDVLANA